MRFVVLGIILSILLISCENRKHPNVKRLYRFMEIGRLDKDLFVLDTICPDVESMKLKYGRFWETYTQGVLNLGKTDDSSFRHWVGYFIKDPIMREVADSVKVFYPDLKSQEKELSMAWAYYSWYFPGHAIPQVYAHVSGFNQSIVVDSAVVGIGLDNYLGENCVFYDMLAVPVPLYARKKMTGNDIVRDVLSGWLTVEYPFRPLVNDLVSGMIYQGKIIYVLEHLFPDKSHHWLLGFTEEQEKWCCDNECGIWTFLIENEYLFTTQQRIIMKYLNDAPFTSGMPVESPGKAVVWTGYKIVCDYMEKADVSLEVLMKEQDYHKILRMAGYRP